MTKGIDLCENKNICTMQKCKRVACNAKKEILSTSEKVNFFDLHID